jgi:hypothetical protein
LQPLWNANFIGPSRLQDGGFERTYLKTILLTTMSLMFNSSWRAQNFHGYIQLQNLGLTDQILRILNAKSGMVAAAHHPSHISFNAFKHSFQWIMVF